MRIETLTTREALGRIEAAWRELPAPSPMQGPDWLLSWWDAYAADDPRERLSVLAFWDEATGRLAGLAPWRVRTTWGGATLRFLADGRAATDHQSVLVASPEVEPAVVHAAARWLHETAGKLWRRARFEGVNDDDRVMRHLTELLGSEGIDVERVPDMGSFAVDWTSCCLEAIGDADGAWEAYLATLSKSRRKRLRRFARERLDAPGTRVVVAETESQRRDLWPVLERLHNERRQGMGFTGAFECPRFARFHDEASARLVASGRLKLAMLEVDGEPLSIDYAIDDPQNGALLVYQGGISERGLGLDAGHLSSLFLARDAMRRGRKRFDLLRGDEPYKLGWGAARRPASTLYLRPRGAAGKVERWALATYRGTRAAAARTTATPATATADAD
jgi:CelD/BcsL family acetyltransferase involved in cellulose biosynthesis